MPRSVNFNCLFKALVAYVALWETVSFMIWQRMTTEDVKVGLLYPRAHCIGHDIDLKVGHFTCYVSSCQDERCWFSHL